MKPEGSARLRGLRIIAKVRSAPTGTRLSDLCGIHVRCSGTIRRYVHDGVRAGLIERKIVRGVIQ